VATPAQADAVPPQPSAAYNGGVIEAAGGAVTVPIDYTCTTYPNTFGNHLFVALKQGPGVSPENASTCSGDVKTFYSTNWKSDAGPNALLCDGKSHHQTIVLKSDSYYPSPVPKFSTGTALLQVCVFDNITGVDQEGNPTGGSATPYTMQAIRAAH
jgi:hypothetical protein